MSGIFFLMLSASVMAYSQLGPCEQISNMFIEETVFENIICKMAAILFHRQWITMSSMFPFYDLLSEDWLMIDGRSSLHSNISCNISL